MKRLFSLPTIATVILFSQSVFSAPYICSMVSKVDGKIGDLFSVKVELTNDMTKMVEIARDGSEPVYGRVAVKQSGDTLLLEVNEAPANVVVVEGKAGAELSYFFSNNADRSIKVNCKPL